jgi:outer membrane receptor protein involved in Fe transport
LRWKFDPHAMLYARIATGFVPGGPNISNPVNTGESSYESSTTVDYELGVKSSFMNEHVLLNASAFRINWQRIQLTGLTSDNFSLVENGTTARSEGAEFSLTVVPIEHLQIGLNGAYTDAYLTGPAPAYVNAQVGARLPQVPLWQLSARAEYDWPLWDTYSGTAGVNWRFTGDRYADFVSSGPRPLIPSSNIVDLRAGIRHEKWSLEGYVKNVGNATSINDLEAETLAGGSGPLAANMYPPRTVGASVTVRF